MRGGPGTRRLCVYAVNTDVLHVIISAYVLYLRQGGALENVSSHFCCDNHLPSL